MSSNYNVVERKKNCQPFQIIDEFLFINFSTLRVSYLPIQASSIPLIMKITGRIIDNENDY